MLPVLQRLSDAYIFKSVFHFTNATLC